VRLNWYSKRRGQGKGNRERRTCPEGQPGHHVGTPKEPSSWNTRIKRVKIKRGKGKRRLKKAFAPRNWGAKPRKNPESHMGEGILNPHQIV